MARRLHIFNRNGVFYWRRRLPELVAKAFGRSHILLSLRSRDRKAASRLASILSANLDQFVHIMQLEQREPTPAEVQKILDQLYRRILEGCRDHRMQRYTDEEMQRGIEEEKRRYPNEEDTEAHFIPDQMVDEGAHFTFPDQTIERLRQDRLENDFRSIRWLLAPILTNANLDVATDTVAFRRFLNVALQFAIKAFEEGHAELEGLAGTPGLEALLAAARSKDGVRPALEPSTVTVLAMASPLAAPATPVPSVPPPAPSQTLSSYFEDFVKQAIDEGVWKKGTEKQNRNSLNLMVRIIGDKPAGTIGRADATALRRTLEKLPNSLGKSPKHKQMTIQQIVDQKDSDEPTMSVSALDRHWRTMVAFVRWLNRQDDVPFVDIDRVFGDFRWAKHVPQEQERLSWDPDSLAGLFSSPIWTGFQPHPGKRYWRHKSGQVVIKDEYWWLPLLAVYHGARLEELCRLTGNDVSELGGIHVMRIRGPHLKNKASERDVPIHSAIIKLGFLELAQRAGDGLLFPRMIAGGPDDKLGYDYSQHFSEYRKKVGVYKERMDFHSFRHLVTTRLLRTEKVLMVDEITGHDSKQRKEAKDKRRAEETDSTTIIYFHGHELQQRQEAIEKLHYPEINLDQITAAATDGERHQSDLARRYPRIWGTSPGERKGTKSRRER